MLDQNTDRMWYVIGAVLIVATIIAMGLNIFRDSFDSVEDNFGSIMGIAGDNIRSIGDSGIYSAEIDPLVEDGYIPIATTEELAYLNESKEQTFGQGTKWEGEYTSGLDGKYIQVKDIDLSGIDNFVPIGKVGSEFTGTFDGGGYVISNLTINRGSENNVGLFGRAEGATFLNVGLGDVNVNGRSYTGGLVGRQNSSTVTNSYATGTVNGTGNNIGGLVGYNQYNSSVFDSYATGTVNGTGNNTGGLVGGQVGSSTVSDSYATANVNGRSQIGGLVGYQWSSSKVVNSYATGSVTGGSYVGGLVGYQEYSSSTVTNSYATGLVTGTGNNTGGLVGYQQDTNSTAVTNSYYDKETTGQTTSDGGTGKTTAEMKNKDTYTGWDESIWTIESGQYPTLR